MSRFKPSQRRSITQRFPIVPQRARTLSDRAYTELGRPQGLATAGTRPPPVATALAFAFRSTSSWVALSPP